MPRYIIHAQEAGSSEAVRKVFEAESGTEARSMAEAIGLIVRAVELDEPGASEGDPFSSAAREAPGRGGPEETVWEGSPSQWTNFWWFVLCIFVITIPWAIWKWLGVRAMRYTITTQRIRVKSGVLSQSVDEIEMYRVKDTELTRSLIQRILGLGTVTVHSSDETTPKLDISDISDAEGLRERLRESVEAVRRARGVRELDVS